MYGHNYYSWILKCGKNSGEKEWGTSTGFHKKWWNKHTKKIPSEKSGVLLFLSVLSLPSSHLSMLSCFHFLQGDELMILRNQSYLGLLLSWLHHSAIGVCGPNGVSRARLAIQAGLCKHVEEKWAMCQQVPILIRLHMRIQDIEQGSQISK